jgi:glucose/arabinose dehydrogenase
MSPIHEHAPIRSIVPAVLFTFLLVGRLVLLPASAHAGAATLPSGFVDELQASGLDLPTGLAELPDAASHTTRRVLFVEQYTARVGLVVGTNVYTVGTVPGISTNDAERGLLGIVVDPGWPARPYIYTQSTDQRSGNHIAISRFTCTGDLSYASTGAFTFNANTRYDLRADFPDNAGNHNGGTLRFGPDGRLYSSLGDDATYCPALDLKVAVGKILRLDVSRLPASGAGPAPYAILTPAGNPWISATDSIPGLVWACGLRNPFRFNVDPSSGMLVIGDVGNSQWEEVDVQGSGGMDFEWPLYEGPVTYTTCSITAPNPMVGPIADYPHPDGEAVVGGPRYRRPGSGSLRFPSEYEGDLFYLDYYGAFMRRLNYNGSSWVPESAPGQPNSTDWGDGFDNVSDVIELSDGTMWYCRQYTTGSQTGEIRRISYPSAASAPPPVTTALDFARPWPNPSRGGVTLAWTQPDAPHVRLAIYGADGRRVRSLLDEASSAAGPHSATWDGLDDRGQEARPGLYFARLEVGGEVRHALLTRLTRSP